MPGDPLDTAALEAELRAWCGPPALDYEHAQEQGMAWRAADALKTLREQNGKSLGRVAILSTAFEELETDWELRGNELEALREQVAELEKRLECPVCLGFPHASKKPCCCDGSNDIRKTLEYFQHAYFDAERDTARDLTAARQQLKAAQERIEKLEAGLRPFVVGVASAADLAEIGVSDTTLVSKIYCPFHEATVGDLRRAAALFDAAPQREEGE